ncbi:MAG: hypothetical protein V4538_03035 [Bacteroidota bacterium]
MGKKILRTIGYIYIVFCIAMACMWFTSYRPFILGYHQFYYSEKAYRKTCDEIKQSNKNLTVNNAQQNLINNFTKHLLPFWLGTRWSFYGTTYVPGEGSIACGYFVTTVLQHLGVKLDRNALAQCASEEMIKTLCSKSNITYANNASLQEFNNAILHKGSGLYIIGLDNHTGFILVQKGLAYFIHSSGRFPFGVVKEEVLTSTVLEKSFYKVFGKISHDAQFIRLYLPSSN